MKKIVSVMLAVMILFSVFTLVTSAVDVPVISFTADKTTVEADEVVTVTVATSANSKICAFTASVVFDADKFEVVSTNVPSGSALGATHVDGNKVNFALATLGAIDDTVTTLFTVQLKVKASGGQIGLNVTEAYCEDNGVDVNVTEGIKATLSPIVITVSETPSETPSEPVVPSEPCADGHVWSSWARIKKPTCSTKGEKIRNCKICGADERGYIDIVPSAHKAGAMKTKVPATATKNGVAVIPCIYCGKELETEVIPMLGDIRNPVIPNTDAVA
jgi:hypothetical protein